MFAGTWEPLYRFIYYRVQNREEAEDITQETYVKAYSHLRRVNIEIEKCTGFLKTKTMSRKRRLKTMSRDEKDLSQYIDSLNAEKKPKEHGIYCKFNGAGVQGRKSIPRNPRNIGNQRRGKDIGSG